MRHRKSGVKLNRTSSHRQAMFRNMVTSLFKYDRIKTTDAKAKELRKWADHIITLAKRGDLHARRQALAIVREKNVVHKLFEEVNKRFGQISGGYTRIIKIGRRPGDAAPVSVIELVDHEDHGRKKKAKKKVKKIVKEQAAEVKAGQTEKKVEAEKDEAEEKKKISSEEIANDKERPEENSEKAEAKEHAGNGSDSEESAAAQGDLNKAQEDGRQREPADSKDKGNEK